MKVRILWIGQKRWTSQISVEIYIVWNLFNNKTHELAILAILSSINTLVENYN